MSAWRPVDEVFQEADARFDDKKFPCARCHEAFPSRRELLEHLKDGHPPTTEGESVSAMAVCPECNKEVKARGLGIHRAKAHGVKGAVAGQGEVPTRPPRRSDPVPEVTLQIDDELKVIGDILRLWQQLPEVSQNYVRDRLKLS